MKIARDSSASAWLDMMRGMAAVAVLIYHVRYRFFLDYSDLAVSGVKEKLFYAATSFGHDAVIVFFVLSGFFISRSVIQGFQSPGTSWMSYALSRLTRLYVVLVPALFITVLCDGIGLAVFPEHPIYTGQPQSWVHDFFPVRARLAPEVFAGNLVFLQTILVPPAGSNDALWSLAYEFWYYALFPCVFVCLTAKHSPRVRLLHGVFAICIGWLVGRHILLYLPIWLMGTVVCLTPKSGIVVAYRRTALVLSLALFASLTLAGHTDLLAEFTANQVVCADYLTAIGFTVVLYSLCHDDVPANQSAFLSIAKSLSAFSYTLYAVHLPILVLLRAWIIPSTPWSPNPTTISAAIFISICVIAAAYILSRFTEARTDNVRAAVLGRLRR